LRNIFYFIFTFLVFTLYSTAYTFAEDVNTISEQRTKKAVIETQNAQKQIDDITLLIKNTTSEMQKNGKYTLQEKEVVDSKIQNLLDYLNNNGDNILYFINQNIDGYSIYNFKNEEMKDVDFSFIDFDNLKLLNMSDFYNTRRIFEVNSLLYINGYRFLTSYLADYAVKPNGNYTLDGMTVTKYASDKIELDLSKAKDYIIEEPKENKEFGIIKVVSPSNNTYIIANIPETGSYEYGYFIPTKKGLAFNLECRGERKTFILNSNGRDAVTNGECFNLRDIFYNLYLKQNNENWNFRNVLSISKTDDKNYTIKLKNLIDNMGLNGSIADEYYKGGNGWGGGMMYSAFITNDFKPNTEFYWNGADIELTEYSYPVNKINLKDGIVITIIPMT